MKKFKKIISMFLVICFTVQMVNVNFVKATSTPDGEKTYIVKVKDDQTEKMERKFHNNSQLVVTHVEKDEDYLEAKNEYVVSLTNSEYKEMKKSGDVESIEEDLNVTGSMLDESLSDESCVLDTMIQYVDDSEDAAEEEYTDDPTAYCPPEAITEESQKTEVVPWNIEMVAGDPRTNEYKGNGVKIAVIDSGIDIHEDLGTSCWVDFSSYVNGYKPIDNNGHGTQVAGIIGAKVNGYGIAGIANEADVYSVKVLDKENKASVSSVIKAIEWCIENQIDVINMSFGMDSYSELLEEAVNKAYDAGIIIVAAAGNGGENSDVQYPAAYNNVIAVGANDMDGNAAEFSSCGTGVELLAPGVDAQTTAYCGSYSTTSGTSIAAAHVAAVVAVLKGIDKTKSNDFIRKLIQASANKVSDATYDSKSGYGIVNLQNAIEIYNSFSASEENMNQFRNLNEYSEFDLADTDTFLEGSWSAASWQSVGGGHEAMINSMSYSLFTFSSSDTTTDMQYHKSIVFYSVYYTDNLERMSASNSGNYARDSLGNITGSTYDSSYASPYHAKSVYSLDSQVIALHLKFLYELARRRLVLSSGLSLTPADYTSSTYYGIALDLNTKRRIIADLAELYNTLSGLYALSTGTMATTDHKGYMVLGVFFHLLGDVYCHRAQFIRSMAFSGTTVSTVYSTDAFVAAYGSSYINGSNITSPSTLLTKLKSTAIPMVDLKDYLNTPMTITVNGTSYTLSSKNQAYEDNPYFFSNRYTKSVVAVKAQLSAMKSDTGSTNSFSFTKYTVVPLI